MTKSARRDPVLFFGWRVFDESDFLYRMEMGGAPEADVNFYRTVGVICVIRSLFFIGEKILPGFLGEPDEPEAEAGMNILSAYRAAFHHISFEPVSSFSFAFV